MTPTPKATHQKKNQSSFPTAAAAPLAAEAAAAPAAPPAKVPAEVPTEVPAEVPAARASRTVATAEYRAQGGLSQ
jgi:hypothetical protein